MKSTSMIAAVALSTAIALTACGPEDAKGGSDSSGGSSNSQSSATSSEKPASEKSSPATSERSTPAASDSSSSGTAADSAATPEQATTVPTGPMTKVSLVKAGGYRKRVDSKFGEFYAVLKMDGSGPGKVKVQYEFLDSTNKVLGSANDTISVGQGKDMIKVSSKLSAVPDGTKRIRLRVLSNTATEEDDDITISGVTVKNDAEFDRPVVTGNYVAHGSAFVAGFQAVCSDANNYVVVGHGTPQTSGAKTGPFTIKLHEAPRHWKAQNCYVGQSGPAF